jgi:hypothetical protein
MDSWRDAVTFALDVLALLLLAAGVAGGMFPWIGWWALALAALVIVGGVQLHEYLTSRTGDAS